MKDLQLKSYHQFHGVMVSTALYECIVIWSLCDSGVLWDKVYGRGGGWDKLPYTLRAVGFSSFI